MENVVSAVENPELAQQIIAEVLADTAPPAAVAAPTEGIKLPPSGEVELLGGYYEAFNGELSMTAVVRELNGEDEEVISRAGDPGRMLLSILSRGVVRVGDEPASKQVLDDLLAGDREYLLLMIRRLTLGDTVEFLGTCTHCQAEGEFSVDLSKIKVDRLEDPVADRRFVVDCRMGKVLVGLPTGSVQKKLVESTDKTGAELDSILLRECVEEIDGLPVVDKNFVKKMGILDRRELLKQISERNPGPRLLEAGAPCSVCGQEVPIPLNLADIFRL